MGINIGAALGAATKSGFDTYKLIEEEKRLQADEARRAEQFKAWQLEKAKEQQQDQALAETRGRIGQQVYDTAIQNQGGAGSQQAQMLAAQSETAGGVTTDADRQAEAGAAINAMRENAGQAALPTNAIQGKEYTEGQANKDYLSKSAGIGRKAYTEALQTSSLARQNKLDTQFDDLMQERQDKWKQIHSVAQEGGLSGLADAAKKEGLPVRFVEGKKGAPGAIEQLDKDGKVVKTYNSIDDAMGALTSHVNEHFVQRAAGLVGSPDKLLTYMNQRKEIEVKQDTANVEKEFKGRGGVYERVHMASIDAQKGKSPTAAYNEKVNALSQSLMDANPGKYKNPAEAKVDAAKMVLHAPAEIKGDANGNYVVGNKLYVPDPKNPGQFMEAKGFGTSALVNAFANYDPSKAPNASPKSALPVQSQGSKQMDMAAIKAGWKPLGTGGDMYFKLGADGEPIHKTGEALAKDLGLVY